MAKPKSAAKVSAAKVKVEEKLKAKKAPRAKKPAKGSAKAKVEVEALPEEEGSPYRNTGRDNYLVVVESPAKAKTIKKYLGSEYTVKASVGHVMDLPKSKIGIDIEKGFEPQYEVIASKVKVLGEIKRYAKGAAKIFLATDPDREGEAIAWHLSQEIGQKDKTFRVTFNEITKRAVQEAIKQPGPLDRMKYDSQQARRILDRIVGYQVSPLLWKKVRWGLSAGRVQSVAVRLVVEREQEIQKFVPQEYWSLEADLEGRQPPPFRTKLVKLDGKKAELKEQAQTHALVKELEGSAFTVARVEKKERRRFPPPPFITSKLQQQAANQLHFSAKKTMTLAQRLYEGVALGDEGQVALITYMRTDSTRLSNDALGAVRGYIEGQYGKESLPPEPIFYKSKKGAQDAHEAIRPTSMEYGPERVRSFLEPDMYRLYELIWSRFVACQMLPAIYDQTTADISAGRALFRATGSRLKAPGFLAVYGEQAQEEEPAAPKGDAEVPEEAGEENAQLPELAEGEPLKMHKLLPEQHFTQPPPRFTEASLVKELEEKGIGRPSTYASILSVIQDKEYVKKEETRFFPTELGKIVTGELVKHFPTEMNVEFTAGLEEKLDKIAEGDADWVAVLKDFYDPFSQTVKRAEAEMRDVKREEVKTDHVCEKCGKPMVIKWGRRGRFIACSGYPECKNTKDFTEGEGGAIRIVEEEKTNEVCPNCAKPMVVKRGRFGRFLACSGYPECKTSKPLSIGVSCPECKQGYLTERRSKRGKVFFSCNRYPDCKFALWDRPLNEACPTCAAPYLLQKFTKRDGAFIACGSKECGYRRQAEEPKSAQA